MTSKLSERPRLGRSRLELEPHLLTLCSSLNRLISSFLLMNTETGGQTGAGAQGTVNQLGKISQMQPVWAARGEGRERDIGSGSSLEHVAATWGIRQVEVELTFRVSQLWAFS